MPLRGSKHGALYVRQLAGAHRRAVMMAPKCARDQAHIDANCAFRWVVRWQRPFDEPVKEIKRELGFNVILCLPKLKYNTNTSVCA